MSSSDRAAGKTLHDRVVALAGLEFLQLLDQVFGVLLRQLGVGRDGRIAVGAMAGRTHGGEAGLALDEIRLGHLRGVARRVGRENRCCQCGSRQQGGEQLHIEGVCLCAQNRAILQ